MRYRERGIALISALILSIIAISFVGALMYLVIHSSQISGQTKRYTSALEVAKGIVDYIINRIEFNQLRCKSNSIYGPCSSSNNRVFIEEPLESKLEGYNISAIYLGESIGLNAVIYSFRVEVTSYQHNERAIIEFVYKQEL